MILTREHRDDGGDAVTPGWTPLGTEPFTRVSQTILATGSDPVLPGNCLQAAIASVLRLPLEAVPHFALFRGGSWRDALHLWAAGRGLTVHQEPVRAVPHQLCVVEGIAHTPHHHAVVGYAGDVVWDPYPGGVGLAVVTDSTWFEVAP